MPTSHKKITIQVIAQRLKLSKATISKALSPHADRSDISAETSERVRAAAARMGWRPDEQRAARARRRVGNIGLVCQRSAPFTGGVYGDFLDGLGVALAALDRRLLFVPALEAHDWSRLLSDQRIDGAILMEPIGEPLIRLITDSHFPAVLINQTTPAPLPQIISDDVHGAETAVAHLAAVGHRRLAFIHSPHRLRHYSVEARIQGFHSACKQHGLDGIDRPQEAAHFITAWHKESAHTRATAVLCYNFSDTLDLITTALARNISIPGDLSVISGDDLPIMAMLQPPVTAVQVQMASMAQQAVCCLHELILGQRRQEPQLLLVPTRLIERGTVRQMMEDG